jgi:predicted MFS family arabinose efflux permease
MLALGAALGGLVAGGWGIYPAFIIDALTFILSAVILTRVVYRPGHDAASGEGGLVAALSQYIEGLRYLFSRPDTFIIALTKAAFALAMTGGFQVIQVPIATQVFPMGEEGGISLGLMYAVVGVGTGLGPIAARHFTGDRGRPMRWAIGLGYLLAALGLLLMVPLASFPLTLFGTFWRGFGSGVNWVFSTQLLLQTLPNKVRGRVFSTEFASQTLMNAAGAAMAGWAFDQTSLGMSGMLWVMAGGLLVGGVMWVGWTLKQTVVSGQ